MSDILMVAMMMMSGLCSVSLGLGFIGGLLIMQQLRGPVASRPRRWADTPATRIVEREHAKVPIIAIPAVMAAWEKAGWGYVGSRKNGDNTVNMVFQKEIPL